MTRSRREYNDVLVFLHLSVFMRRSFLGNTACYPELPAPPSSLQPGPFKSSRV